MSHRDRLKACISAPVVCDNDTKKDLHDPVMYALMRDPHAEVVQGHATEPMPLRSDVIATLDMPSRAAPRQTASRSLGAATTLSLPMLNYTGNTSRGLGISMNVAGVAGNLDASRSPTPLGSVTSIESPTSPGASPFLSPNLSLRSYSSSTSLISHYAPSSKNSSVSPSPPLSGHGPCTLSASDFFVLKLLGVGHTSKVFLVRHAHTSSLHALKVVVKEKCSHVTLENVLREQRLLVELAQKDEGRFLEIVASWNDDKNFYILTRYYCGDLATETKRFGILRADRIMFYAAELVDAVCALHDRQIAHRDIKPANILVRADGHIVLADFGLAQHVGLDVVRTHRAWRSRGGEMTDAVAGSPSFMSPQMHRGERCGCEADVWALGVMLFRMMTHRMPFGGGCRNHKELAKSIRDDPLIFMEGDGINDVAKDFLSQLLCKDPTKRITLRTAKTHPYFNGVNWADVATRENWVPYKPFKPVVPKRHETSQDLLAHGTPYTTATDPHPEFAYIAPALELALAQVDAQADTSAANLRSGFDATFDSLPSSGSQYSTATATPPAPSPVARFMRRTVSFSVLHARKSATDVRPATIVAPAGLMKSMISAPLGNPHLSASYASVHALAAAPVPRSRMSMKVVMHGGASPMRAVKRLSTWVMGPVRATPGGEAPKNFL